MHYLSQTAVLSKEAASIIISDWLTLFTLLSILPLCTIVYGIWWLTNFIKHLYVSVHFNNNLNYIQNCFVQAMNK